MQKMKGSTQLAILLLGAGVLQSHPGKTFETQRDVATAKSN
jgi:hypothetical protein